MSSNNFQSRINYDGDMSDLVAIISDEYSLGNVRSFNIIEVGFEDLNIKLDSSNGTYVVKVFSKKSD